MLLIARLLVSFSCSNQLTVPAVITLEMSLNHFHKHNLRHLPRFPDFFVTDPNGTCSEKAYESWILSHNIFGLWETAKSMEN